MEFHGNNSITPIQRLMLERGNYKSFAFPENGGRGPSNVLDFNFAERTQYGKVNIKGNAVIARQDTLKPVVSTTDSNNTVMLQNFMADAYSDFVNHMQRACQLRIIKNDHPFLSGINAVTAYMSPVKMFREYMDAQMAKFNDVYLRNLNELPQIMNFGHYCTQVVHFLKILGQNHPITLSGYHRSKRSSIFTSGFAVDIAGLDMSDDDPKDELFIKDENFPYYIKVARYYGLVVAKNAPFVLAADLSSPAMRPYLNANGIFSMKDTFTLNFQEAIGMDIQFMKNIFIDQYNNFVRLFPLERIISVCKSGRTKSMLSPRVLTNLNLVNQKYDHSFFNGLYIELRNIEERNPYKQADLKRMKRNANFFYKSLGPERSMAYINEQFRQLYKFKRGNSHETLKRIKLKKQAKMT